MQIGSVVRSAAGRDKGLFMVVSAFESNKDGNFAYIADGKLRKLQSPKKKRIKHLKITNTVLNMTDITDKSLRERLKEFNDNI